MFLPDVLMGGRCPLYRAVSTESMSQVPGLAYHHLHPPMNPSRPALFHQPRNEHASTIDPNDHIPFWLGDDGKRCLHVRAWAVGAVSGSPRDLRMTGSYGNRAHREYGQDIHQRPRQYHRRYLALKATNRAGERSESSPVGGEHI